MRKTCLTQPPVWSCWDRNYPYPGITMLAPTKSKGRGQRLIASGPPKSRSSAARRLIRVPGPLPHGSARGSSFFSRLKHLGNGMINPADNSPPASAAPDRGIQTRGACPEETVRNGTVRCGAARRPNYIAAPSCLYIRFTAPAKLVFIHRVRCNAAAPNPRAPRSLGPDAAATSGSATHVCRSLPFPLPPTPGMREAR
ncbi:hypothetical protein VTG60DRAFT_6150 [Thermothelomyces hinnuleus]